MECIDNTSFGVVLLAGGRGSRMNSDVPKQYMDIGKKPVLYYSLKQFEDNSSVKGIILVVSRSDIDMVRYTIVERYGFKKVKCIVEGGAERFNSVYNGLLALDNSDYEYVMIHDGARPCISQKLLTSLQTTVIKEKACIPAVPSKDTVKLADDSGYVKLTPDRSTVWNVQTPQTFELSGILSAFRRYMKKQDVLVTDDSMVWELHNSSPVKLIMGDYTNIKITTPEDIEIAERNLMDIV